MPKLFYKISNEISYLVSLDVHRYIFILVATLLVSGKHKKEGSTLILNYNADDFSFINA